jgi:hypothetical protein
MAANEKATALTKLTLTAPNGLAFGTATRSPAGWRAARTPTVITWSGGSVAPGSFEQWGFEIESADQPGPIRYKVTLGFADGSGESHDVEITAEAAGAAGGSTAGPTVTSGTPPTGSATTVMTETPSTAEAPAPSESGRANVALGVGAAALLLSVVALALAIRARQAGGGTGGSTPGGTTDAGTRDW